ncbi:cytochrome bd-I terminal oxidase subunit I domain protein [Salmonella enterica subsp. enterica]|nr:cytochrome bd-I terminal oxidase subunit I domain protein [Salmonella enterica subsp. enterica]
MWDVIDLSRWQFALTALYHFFICSSYAWADFFAGRHGDDLCGDGENRLPRYDAFLGQALRDQFLLSVWLPA